MTPVDKAVLETLSFFEQFKRALSVEEIHQLLWQRAAFASAVESSVNHLTGQKLLVKQGNLVALNTETILMTGKRQRLISRYRAAALKIARILQRIPGIQSVLLMNSLAMQTLKAASDIDLMIISSPGHLYTARALAIASLEMRGLNKSITRQAGKACLGYWLAEDNLSVEQYQTEPHTAAYWIATMVPLVGFEAYSRFIEANDWVKDDLPNWQMHETAHLEENESRITNRESRLGNRNGGLEPCPSGALRKGGCSPETGKISRIASRPVEHALYHLSRYRIMLQPEFRYSDEMLCEPNILKLHSFDKRPSYGKHTREILDRLLIQ